MVKKLKLPIFRNVYVFLLIFLIGVGFGYGFLAKGKIPQNLQQEKNTPKAFLSEVYDKIKENYWENLSDAQLLDIFRLSIEKVGGPLESPKIASKEALSKIMDKQPQHLTAVIQTVLASLNPLGRSGLYTQKQEIALKNTVENVNPEKDLYKDLGLPKNASEAAVSNAFEKKSQELASQNTTQAKEQLKQITYAKEVLTQKESKQRYDEKGVEPAISAKALTSEIVYLKFSKFSPTSLEEFQQALNVFQNSPVNSLIFDLRGNVGGAIDATAYFLGFFLGKNQYAFDFYHKGEYIPFKTQTDKLPVINKFRQIVVLVDNNTQSSAEMLASSLKKYNVGVVLGVPTKGWGTVERVFPLDNQFDKENKFSLFLVHSITLRDDNLPIEGRGVEPNINITDPNWQSQLNLYFRNQNLINAVRTVL